MAETQSESVPAKGAGPQWPRWLEELYAIADNLDTAGFVEKIGARGTMRFANGPLLSGSEEIEATVAGLFSAITSMSHRPLRVWLDGADVIFEAVVTYGRPDGQQVDIPAVTAYTRAEDGTLHGRIYCDLAPVFASV